MEIWVQTWDKYRNDNKRGSWKCGSRHGTSAEMTSTKTHGNMGPGMRQTQNDNKRGSWKSGSWLGTSTGMTTKKAHGNMCPDMGQVQK